MRALALPILLFPLACLAEDEAPRSPDDSDEYPLDELDRAVPGGGIDCAGIARTLVEYRGTHVKMRPAARVHPAFVHRLVRFETLVVTLGREVYGRAPARLRNGTFRCRPIAKNTARVSEHALGNAIDVVAFEFDAARGSEHPRAFSVRIDRHWNAAGADAVHACFLRTLADRLSKRHDVFRGMIGPADPDHRDHFHLDAGPWPYERF